jgi:hypothetical protein
MGKKQYIKLSMKVYEFEQKTQLLAGSGAGGDINAPVIPGLPEDDMFEDFSLI